LQIQEITEMPNDTAQVTSIAALRKPMQSEQQPIVRAGFNDLQGFELMQRQCKALASSTLVPQQFQGNMPNCLIALEMAQRIGASPLMVMQNLYIVHGRPGWSAKFLIASFNQCGRFSAIRFKFTGTEGKDDWGCRAYATEKETGEKIQGPLITIALAKKEGWYQKNGSKWQSIPELMLQYRAAAWMVNTHAPEISMGLNTADELGDTFDASRTDDGDFTVTTAQLRQEQEQTPADTAPEDTASLLDQVKAICQRAAATKDDETAWLVLDEANTLVKEMKPENAALAQVEIAAASDAIKARKE
jgi:hypothetical protein